MARTLKQHRSRDQEQVLIRLALAGNREAFDSLVRQNFAKVHSVLFRLVGNHEDAEDLAQECFVRAYRSLRWFRGKSSLSTWLISIAIHLARDAFRARNRRPAHFPVETGLQVSAPEASDPTRELSRKELLRVVQEGMEDLPLSLREVFVLRVLEKLPYEQVSRITGYSTGTCRIQVLKARRILLRRIQPWLEAKE